MENGGIEAEREVRAQHNKDLLKKQSDACRRNVEEEARWRENRKKAMANLLSELKQDKEELIQKRSELKKKFKEMSNVDPERTRVTLLIKGIEEKLK